MTRHAHRASIAALALTLALAASDAFATAQRTFVASNGVDTNPCTLTSPCRSFATAAAQTNPGGEIIILDSAGYGTVTLTQSISIIAPAGVYAGISVPSGQSGITINSPPAHVLLRGLVINGQGGTHGILVQAATRVQIESCVISRMSFDGIVVTSSPPPDVYVTDSVISENAGVGIHAASAAKVTVNRVRIEAGASHGIANEPTATFALSVTNSVISTNNGQGIELRATGSTAVNASVSDSELTANTYNAVDVQSGGPTSTIVVAVVRNTMRANQRGVYVTATSPGVAYVDVQSNNIVGGTASGVYALNSKVTVSGNSITSNNYGIYQDGTSIVESIGNNMVRNNASGDVFGTVSGIPGI